MIIYPKVEVSFQDYFSGTSDDYIGTVKYIFRELKKQKINQFLGLEIFLFEKDDGFICNVAKIEYIEKKELENLIESGVKKSDFELIQGKPVFIKLGKYFKLDKI